MSTLSNKNCLVTGATRGIGRAIATMLAAAGAHVAICGRTQESVDRAVRDIAADAGNKVKGKAADVRNYREVMELFEFLGQELGPLDVLVNNAGIGMFGSVGELSVDQWRAVLETNLFGTFYCVKEALPGFETRGGGHIVNIGSLAGAHAFAGGAAYNASKFGVAGFTDAVMQDLRVKNIRVSQVMPGSVATDFGKERGVATKFGKSGATEFGRSGAPTEFGQERAVATGFGKESGGDPPGADWKIWPEDVAEVVRVLLEMPERTLISRVELRPSRPKR